MSADYQVKNFSLPEDQSQWLDELGCLERPHQDVFLLPGYARVYENLYQAKAGLFCLNQGRNRAVHIFLRRPVHLLPFYEGKEEAFDIITPEYSGPIIECPAKDKENFIPFFLKTFNDFCRENKIVCEFGRVNPYYNGDKDTLEMFSARMNRRIVYVDLLQTEDIIRKGFSKGNRSSIKKAQRQGVEIKKDVVSQESIKKFYELYASTMSRNQASRFYFFSLEFFLDLFSSLKDNISLFSAFYKSDKIASSVFLHLGNYIHYYFSGSDQHHLSLCPNNLLLYEAILWAKKEGYKVFSLGGGYHNSGADSLYSFKSSFSGACCDFYTYSTIHDSRLYQQLCMQFRAYSNISGVDNQPNGYFPEYRRPQ